ncbi:MAG: hypothetical protein H6R26_2027 [Proteobacteria bacterium]|jgi:hypothetical protein|nr:hypothetical protein [Pseudomonadota bacterium]
MDAHQFAFERGVGEAFIAWFNVREGRHFVFDSRPEKAPDLLYRDGSGQLALEIAGAYYDSKEATVWWGAKRGDPGTPREWSGKNMDEMLVSSINTRLTEKCLKSYGSDCMLVIYAHPLMTTAEELDSLRHRISMPLRNPFREIYLTGFFPMSSGGSRGGYYVWRLG